MTGQEAQDAVSIAEQVAIANGLARASASLDSRPLTPSPPPTDASGSTATATATTTRRFKGLARRTFGILLLLATVFLWTASNFLSILADNSYSKPYFVTYVNAVFFAGSLPPICLGYVRRYGWRALGASVSDYWHGRVLRNGKLESEDGEGENLCRPSSIGSALSVDDGAEMLLRPQESRPHGGSRADGELNVRDVTMLSLEFSLLWFIANYFVAACLTYTSVASSTILTSTSSIWTLVFGALAQVESFSCRKLIGVLASVAGIVLISSIDLSGDNDKNRGSFPHKSRRQIAIGDAMALFSALMYGIYTVVMKKRIGDESRVNMPLFFGLVGLFNVTFLWPGFFILHLTHVEAFQLPPTGKVWLVILANSAFSFISDYCWAYAVMLTTPLVVTVGLSLTIPLSLVGQMVLRAQYSTLSYWVGAFIVLVSFLFVNNESHEKT